MTRSLVALAAAVGALAVPAGASAASFTFFKTPSGNISCAFIKPGGKSVRCDIRETDNAEPKRPKSCEFDYGHAYAVTRTGTGKRLCAGDTVADPKARTIGYGHSITRFGIKCTSRESGLRCVNRRGHGFSLARGSQSLF